ncbi:MAG: glycosyltransferase family 4 protein [Gammaproteobacteria bacterium]|nr:glycosyltransferase family 4 protein [Gammaproteobacteria bacterium]
MPTPLKLIHVISANDVFGPEKTTINECRALIKEGWDCQIINFWDTDDIPIRAKAEAAGVPYRCIISHKRFDYGVVAELKKTFEETGCDLVHSHGYKSDLYCHLAARRLPTKTVTTIHGWTSENLKVRLYEKMQAFIWRFYDRVFAVSRQYRDIAIKKGVPHNKLHILYNGIIYDPKAPRSSTEDKQQARKKFGLKEDDISIGIVGRLSIEKAHDFYLEVAALVVKEQPQAKFLIIGDGLQYEPLKKQVQQLGITDNVIFAGHVDDMQSAYDAMEIEAICSHREGLPNALLEAMLNEIPVISVAVGGVPDVVEDEQGGIIINNRDPKKFARKLKHLIESAELRQQLGVKGRNQIKQNFTFQRRLELVTQHYRELIGA